MGYDSSRLVRCKGNSELNIKLEDLATTTPETSWQPKSFISRFFTALKERLIAWFADAANGITDLYVKIGHFDEVHANKLCAGTTCITETQLAAVLSATSQSPAPPSPQSNVPEPAPAPPSPEPPPTDTATSTDSSQARHRPQRHPHRLCLNRARLRSPARPRPPHPLLPNPLTQHPSKSWTTRRPSRPRRNRNQAPPRPTQPPQENPLPPPNKRTRRPVRGPTFVTPSFSQTPYFPPSNRLSESPPILAPSGV